MIEMDEFLYGDPSWESVVEFFRDGDFHEEGYLVVAIRKWLVTEEQTEDMNENDMTVCDMLNGRVHEGALHVKDKIYKGWNEKLGFKYFGG